MRSGRRQAAEQEVERRFCRARRASGGKNGDPMTDLSRRRLLAAGASAAASAAAVAGLSSCSGGDDASRSAKTAEAAASSPTAAPKNPAQWLIDENAKPGTDAWPVPDTPALWEKIRGYATATSINRGGTVDLRVSTAAPEWRVEALRMGWYGGVGARMVWQSESQKGVRQAAAVLNPAVGTWTAPWETSVQVTADQSWPPGMYLLKLVSSDGGMSYVPLVVRDDANAAALLIQSSVTTWQAYNEWGGKSLYDDVKTGNKGRADVVTFDRPYYRNGSGEYFGRESDMVMFVERLGLDVTYWTDLDLHAQPHKATEHKAVISQGHDEYYSTPMRRGLEAARDAGVNLAFIGANACFRKIRMVPNAAGENRLQVNYRSATRDPITATDPSEATVSWRSPPSNDPESSLIGNLYESNPVAGDMKITNADNWMFEGSGLRNGDVLPGLIGNEYDRVQPERTTPHDIEVLCHSPVVCQGKNTFADVTWYTADSGAGVFAVRTFEWVKRLGPDTSTRTPSAAHPQAALQKVTQNVFEAMAAGPAGRSHPAKRNLEQMGIVPGYVKNPPST